MLLLGFEPGTHCLHSVDISSHHLSPSTLTVGQQRQIREWILRCLLGKVGECAGCRGYGSVCQKLSFALSHTAVARAMSSTLRSCREVSIHDTPPLRALCRQHIRKAKEARYSGVRSLTRLLLRLLFAIQRLQAHLLNCCSLDASLVPGLEL